MGRTFKAKQQLLKQFNLNELDLLRGKNSLIYPCIQNPNLCWKIYYSWPVERDAQDVLVNDVPLSDLSKIQNFANLHGLAPKIYNQKVIRFFDNKFYFAQLTDFVKGENTIPYNEIYDKVMYLVSCMGLKSEKRIALRWML